MRRIEVVLLVVRAAVILGGIATLGYADKPEKPTAPPEPLLVCVTGGIEGEGDPAQMQVTFADSSFGDLPVTYVANPDGPLGVLGVRKGTRTLRYYYCDACELDGSDCCADPTHDPSHYYALIIDGGALEGKKETEQVVFPAGSSWEIRSKEPYGATYATGTLETPVIYKQCD